MPDDELPDPDELTEVAMRLAGIDSHGPGPEPEDEALQRAIRAVIEDRYTAESVQQVIRALMVARDRHGPAPIPLRRRIELVDEANWSDLAIRQYLGTAYDGDTLRAIVDYIQEEYRVDPLDELEDEEPSDRYWTRPGAPLPTNEEELKAARAEISSWDETTAILYERRIRRDWAARERTALDSILDDDDA